jgi:ABC-type lipoprotein release transport system permease subunit
MASSELTYAVRSIRRNVRRTLLSVVGIAIGVALMLIVESFNRGKIEVFTRVGAESGAGHLRVTPAGWRVKRDPRMRLADSGRALREARALPGVAVAAPRVRAQALLAMGTHVVPVELVGVDPVAEPRAFRYARRVTEGRWLQEDDAGTIVIGRAIADQLAVALDDELLATTVGRGGQVEGAMLRIVGIVATGTEEVDLMISHAPLADVERLTAIAGLGEVTLLLSDWRGYDAARADLQRRLAGTDEVLTWPELVPDLVGHAEQENQTSRLVTEIIMLVVLIGVASAQLASVLERRREFAVLSALGMGGPALVRVVLAEGLALGLVGGLAGLAVGGPLVWLLTTRGLDLSSMYGRSMAFGGTVIDPIIYGSMGSWMLPEAFLVAIVATVLASLYPAWFAARTDPAQALRVAQ